MKAETRKKLESLLQTLGKRPKAVLTRLLENESVSTYELGVLGYDQPPRAAQDLKEHGVKLRVTHGKHPETGNRMGIYWLDDEQPLLDGTFNGRQAFPKDFRRKVFNEYQSHCLFCGVALEDSRLQIDHRIPYQIAGEINTNNVAEFMPLCSSHQRTKSWACEHCPNYTVKNGAVCKGCYWAIPDGPYDHVATIRERRLVLTWSSAEIEDFITLSAAAKDSNQPPSEFVKRILSEEMVRRRASATR